MASADLVCSVGSEPCHHDNRLKYHPHIKHRGHKADPLYRIRRLLTKAHERVDEKGHEKMRGLLDAGDPFSEVADCYTAKEAVRELYSFTDFELAGTWINELIADMKQPHWPVEVRSLGRTLKNWRAEIIAWHKIQISNGPTEGAIQQQSDQASEARGF